MVYQLDDDLWFPDPRLADEDGCLAVGGDLSIDRLLLAYQHGIFPWFSFRDNEEPVWYCPHERFVIFPNEIHISHSMRTLLNKKKYTFTLNEDFEGVIHNCSKLRYEEEGAWLGEDIIKAYTELHRQGFAASVEVWEEERLVGGLYGVNIGSAFFGESMFSLVPSGSKLALIHLAKTMQELNGSIIDCQLKTAHLESMGGRYISYDEYMKLISSC
ncbi:leucyl/phenylalanyl-tRNA--protein transferase [Prevotella communis]|uniref:Leucyl/phenylalanyl-tRNA--protein transferase n=1 Tax=Prevotella communis TaxID=2913614 RepID=A0A1H0G576_9BACT|nr:leucyl/phenylalanyl-tRNA--protein transferase [Prevotella communis]SDG46450.1 leucyl/phenylalanyl-tRNA--protein transferase [Prevotella communis]SDO02016.1 leucyl/phenylalanyl-tRNA--protein transferase [Prevotella communis]